MYKMNTSHRKPIEERIDSALFDGSLQSKMTKFNFKISQIDEWKSLNLNYFLNNGLFASTFLKTGVI